MRHTSLVTCLLILMVTNARAFQTIGQQSNMVIIDGMPYESMQFTNIADTGDFGQTFPVTFVDSVKVNHSMTVEFDNPELQAVAQRVGYIPARKLLISRTVCEKEAPSRSAFTVLNYTDTAVPAAGSLPQSYLRLVPKLSAHGKDARQIMNHDHYWSTAGRIHSLPHDSPVVFRPQGFLGALGLIAGVALMFMMPQGSRGGGQAIQQASNNNAATTAAFSSFQKQLDNMFTSIAKIQDAQTGLAEKQLGFDQELQDSQTNLTNYVGNQVRTLTNTQVAWGAKLSGDIDAFEGIVNAQMINITNLIVNTTYLLNSSIHELDQKLYDHSVLVDANFRQVAANISAVYAYSTNLSAIAFNKISDVSGMLRSAVDIIRRGSSRLDLRIAMARLWVESMSIWNNTDSVPFLDTMGIMPNSSDLQYYRYVENVVWLTYTQVVAGSSIFVSQRMRYYCLTDTVTMFPPSVLSFEDVFLNVGSGIKGQTCTVAAGNCSCWIMYSTQTCTLKASVVNSSVNTDWYDGSYVANASLCANNQTTQEFPVAVPDDIEPMLRVPHCNVTLYPGSTYRVFSYRHGTYVSVPYDNNMCTMPLSQICQSDYRRGYIWSWVSLMMDAFAIGSLNLGPLIITRWGQAPSSLTFAATTYREMDGDFATCTTFSYLVVPNATDWLPVYRITVSGQSATVRITFDGQSYSNSTDSVISPNLPISASDIHYVVGDPLNGTVIYDIPNDMITVVNDPYAMHGKVTCMMCSNNPNGVGLTASGCDMASWKTKYQVDFDATACSVSPSLFLAPVDPSTGVCTGTRQPGSGSWCEIRDNYQVVASSQNSSSSNDTSILNFVLKMKRGRVINTVSLPTGTVIQSLVTACPSIGVDAITSPTTMWIKMTNTQSKTVRVNVVRTGSPCEFNTTVSIAPTQTLSYPVDRTCQPPCDATCLANNPNGASSAVFVTALAANGTLIFCNQEPIITRADEAVFADIGVATPKAINASITALYSTTSIMTMDLFAQLSQFIFSNYIATVQMTMAAGVPINDTAIATGLSMADALNNLINQALAQQKATKDTNYPNVTNDFGFYLKQMQDINDTNNAFMASATARLEASQQAINGMSADLSFIKNNLTGIRNTAQQTVAEGLNNVTVALNNSLNGITAAMAKINKGGGWGSNLGGLAGGFEDIGNAIAGVATFAADQLANVFGSASNFVSLIFIVFIGGICVAVIVALFVLYKSVRNKFKPEKADVSDEDRLEDQRIAWEITRSQQMKLGNGKTNMPEWKDVEDEFMKEIQKTSHISKNRGFCGRSRRS